MHPAHTIVLAALVAASSHGFAQCVKVVSSGQIVCPANANSTAPIRIPGKLKVDNPKLAAGGAAKVGAGVLGTGAALYKRDPTILTRSSASLVNGADDLKRSKIGRTAPGTVLVPRPSSLTALDPNATTRK